MIIAEIFGIVLALIVTAHEKLTSKRRCACCGKIK